MTFTFPGENPFGGKFPRSYGFKRANENMQQVLPVLPRLFRFHIHGFSCFNLEILTPGWIQDPKGWGEIKSIRGFWACFLVRFFPGFCGPWNPLWGKFKPLSEFFPKKGKKYLGQRAQLIFCWAFVPDFLMGLKTPESIWGKVSRSRV